MNSARIDKQARKAGGLQARRTLHALLACALLLGGGLAQAQQGRDDGGQQQERRGERFRLPQQERDARPQERDPRQQDVQARSYGQASQQGYPAPAPQQDRSRSGRMTADERAEMRRQVNEAKDFYPQRR